jgi:hypothetical protein
MRIELRDGQWAEMREHITHAEDKALRKAHWRGREDEDARGEYETLMVRTFTRTWHVLDATGAEIPYSDDDAIDRADHDVVDTLYGRAAQFYTGATNPNQSYAEVIVKLGLGVPVYEAEIDALPDPELFRDALLLAAGGYPTSAKDLEETDAQLLALVHKLRNVKVKKS